MKFREEVPRTTLEAYTIAALFVHVDDVLVQKKNEDLLIEIVFSSERETQLFFPQIAEWQ
jgi:hypothetical protein